MAYYKALIICSCLFGLSCANIQGIKGGPEDKDPPVLVKDKSSPNFQLRFKDREIVLTFNEWIRIDNPGVNISISPTTQYPPEYKLKGKRIFIQFDEKEILQENTTYVIQFGESIKDITSGNIQRDLKYVFSTGDYLDSLSVQVKLIDAFTTKPKEKILVSLYKLLDDTAFQKIKPFYFAWTDTSGIVTINNMSPGRYRLYALDDKNQNYYYDQITEAFAFYPELIEPKEISEPVYKLFLSSAAIPSIIKEKKLSAGKTVIHFKEKPVSVKLDCDSDQDIKFVNLKDSFLIWNVSALEMNCILSYDSKQDTFLIKASDSTIAIQRIKMEQKVLKPEQWPGFFLNDPVFKVAIEKIYSLDSISRITAVHYDSTDPRKFYLEGIFSSSIQNRIVIPENAVHSVHPTGNVMDTFAFNYLEKASLSKLNLRLDALQTGQSYILQLLNNQNVIEDLPFEATDTIKNVFFKYLIPGKYEIRMIHDKNRNGQWDPADYNKKVQPEIIWYFELTELRADWDIEVRIKL